MARLRMQRMQRMQGMQPTLPTLSRWMAARPPRPQRLACKRSRPNASAKPFAEGADLGGCLAYAALCPDYYFNADSARTVAGLVGCVRALAARTCTDVIMGVFPSCYVYGHRPTGAGCAYPSQCESGVCGSLAACATCGSGGLPNGSTCTKTAECRPGSYCEDKKCVDAGAIMHASEGQPCNLQAAPAIGCLGDLICRPTSSGGAAGTCTAPPGPGEPCALAGFSADICSPGNTCSTPTGGTCSASDAGTSPPPQPGVVCDDQSPCHSPLLCRSGVCEPLGSNNCPANGGGAI